MDEISDVEGLYPTFVLNEMTPTSLRVASTNGVGNVWGLDPEPLMSEYLLFYRQKLMNHLAKTLDQFGNLVPGGRWSRMISACRLGPNS